MENKNCTNSYSMFIPDILPMSLNNMQKSTPTGTRYKTKEARIWESSVMTYLIYNMKKDAVAHLVHPFMVIELELIFQIPPAMALTIKGHISARGGDTDNYIKPFKDILFRHIEVNDRFVYKDTAVRIPSDQIGIFFGLRFFDLRTHPLYSEFFTRI
jgi:hypothetical protein